jgi:hypothetical protein
MVNHTNSKGGGFLPNKQALLIFIVFTTLQVLDGVFSVLGIERHGLELEANSMLRPLMAAYGHATVLLWSKFAAISAIALVAHMSRKVDWVRAALALCSLAYLFFAVLPWVFILYAHELPS